MRKQFVGIATLVLVIALGAVTASAQVLITLGTPTSPIGASSGSVTFTGTATPGTDTLTFGTCQAGSNCWSGNTTGFAGPNPLANDFWEISFASAGTVTMDASGNITQGGPASFSLGTTNGGNTLLTGNLQLVSFAQFGHLGAYNDQLVANLTVTGGTLAPYFSNSSGVVTVLITIASGTNVFTLGNGQTVVGTNPVGTLTSTPEPSSVLLLGSGLMVFGAVLRRKLLR